MSDRSPATLAVWLVAGVLAVLAALRLFGGDGGGEAAPLRIDGGTAAAGEDGAARPADGSDGARAGGRPGAATGTYVHVAGAVRRPGLYRLAAGARVATALQRAGGPLRGADVGAVNLAATLEDGQQVMVPRRGEVAAAGQAGTATSGAGTAAAAGAPKLSLATAAAEQLEELDGIGPTLAERIVEFREANGGFRSLGELREVEGIGEKRFASLEEALQP